MEPDSLTGPRDPAACGEPVPGSAPRLGPRGVSGSGPPSDVISRIGGTPLLRLSRVGRDLPRGVELWAKAEHFNPGGSVKDRAALAMVRSALADGRLPPGKTLLDASSGNTGIAYALLGALWGFPVEIILPKNASMERQRRILAYGARIRFSSPLEGTDGAQRLAKELAKDHPDRYFYPDQYNNPCNVMAHYRTTGPEIWRDSAGLVTHFVAGVGTGGTITGVGRYLKERRPEIRVTGVVPDSPLHGIEGLKHLETSLRPGILDDRYIDDWSRVSTDEAQRMTLRLAREEGLFVGTSSGAAVHAALKLGAGLEMGVLVTLLPDGGDRYLGEQYWNDGDR